MSKTGAPHQPRQPSRKGKKAWRKNVDIFEVEEGLEALREDITQGGPLAEKESGDIFAVDTTSSEAIRKQFGLQKPLKADEILSKRSAVDAVDSRKRPRSGLTNGIVHDSSRRKSDWVSKKDIQRLKAVVKGSTQLINAQVEEQEAAASSFDLWSPPVRRQTHGQSLNSIAEARPKAAPATLQRPPIALTLSGKPVRAVSHPQPASSYNPSFEDWDTLLIKEGQKEIEAERARRLQATMEAGIQERIAASAAEAEQAERADIESAWEGFETEPEGREVLAKTLPKRKTPAQRNKIKRRKAADRLAKHEQNTGKRLKQVAPIEESFDDVRVEYPDLRTVADKALKSDSDDDGQIRRKRLGNKRIPDKPLEVVLPEELQDSLRRLKPEGNLLEQRFRNLLVNGKIETRKPVLQSKKARRTYTEKWVHKDFSIAV